MDAPHRSRLAPRLVLVFAVLACLFGWGNAVAAAAGQAEQNASSTVAIGAPATDAAVDGHSRAHASSAGTVGPTAGTPAQPDHGHGGHGSGHDHAVTCMASSAAAVLGAVCVADAAALVISAVPPLTCVHEETLPAAERPAPSITTLCVQRT